MLRITTTAGVFHLEYLMQVAVRELHEVREAFVVHPPAQGLIQGQVDVVCVRITWSIM